MERCGRQIERETGRAGKTGSNEVRRQLRDMRGDDKEGWRESGRWRAP